MDTSGFDKEIGELITQLNAIRNQMEPQSRKIIKAIIAFAIDWSENKVREAIGNNPDRAISLGKEGLSQVKADLNRLKESMRQLAEDEFLQDNYWTHRRACVDTPENEYDIYVVRYGTKTSAPALFNEGLKLLLGNTGKILFHYGFDQPSAQGGYWTQAADGRIRYAIGFDITEDLRDVLEKYGELASEFSKIHSRLGETKLAKSKAEADDLWNRA